MGLIQRPKPGTHDRLVRRVVRNLSYLFAYQVVSRLLGLVLNLVLARKLEDVGFGRYSLILVIVMLVGLAADFGTANILIREISRQRQRANALLAAALFLRSMTTATVAVAVLIILITTGVGQGFALPLMIATLSIIPTSMSTAIEAAFQAFERMDLSALADVVFSLVLTAAGVAIVSSGGGVTQMTTFI
jgi:O-antigen/teichoic acid export membrane protein